MQFIQQVTTFETVPMLAEALFDMIPDEMVDGGKVVLKSKGKAGVLYLVEQQEDDNSGYEGFHLSPNKEGVEAEGLALNREKDDLRISGGLQKLFPMTLTTWGIVNTEGVKSDAVPEEDHNV